MIKLGHERLGSRLVKSGSDKFSKYMYHGDSD